MGQWQRMISSVCVLLLLAVAVLATETENINLRVVPAPGRVTIDGKTDDWDLSGSLFSCSDVENQREQFGLWFTAMYDADNVYFLVRWVDPTPMNNAASSIGGFNFSGDSLQIRIVTGFQTPQQRVSHWDAWHSSDGKDVISTVYGFDFAGGSLVNPTGAREAFLVNADKRGYVQEIALPWKYLTKDEKPLPARGQFILTIHPHFTSPPFGVHSPDIWRPGASPNRVSPFMDYPNWGIATLEPAGKLPLRPVRLTDGREFPVKATKGNLAVDWTGLIKSQELRGFIPIRFTMPEDGYVSLLIKDETGKVVRQLLNAAFYTKGNHEAPWDGLTNPHYRYPGQPVAPGKYTWQAIWHKGVSLRLRGWAANAGSAPWGEGPTTNWGADHGVPISVAADGNQVFLGWNGAEAGRSMVACDLNGNTQWRGQMDQNAAAGVAADGGIVFAENTGLYRYDAKTGAYRTWEGMEHASATLPLKGITPGIGEQSLADAVSARDGRLWLAYSKANQVLELDARTGAMRKSYAVPSPRALEAAKNGQVYILSGTTTVLALNAATGQTTTVMEGLPNACALTVDGQNRIYVGEGEPQNIVKVFAADGKPLLTIGREGGRPLLGKWVPEGMRFINDLAVDAEGKLWVAEADRAPKRFSVWDTTTGKFIKEFLGPSAYGAVGGAIDPLDPDVMFGQGCEWRLDPKTGRGICQAVVTREDPGNAKYVIGPNGRLYLVTGPKRNWGPVQIFERTGEATYVLRAVIMTGAKETTYWADENGDGQQQPQEVTSTPEGLMFSAWNLRMAPDMSFYVGWGTIQRYALQGFTPCGAPKYDITHPEKLPIPATNQIAGLGSPDGKWYVARLGEHDNFLPEYPGEMVCYERATGKEMWRYPDDYRNVGGFARGPAMPVPGMLRGAFECVGTISLPDPIGAVWAYPTDCGEWHLLTQDGYYLTHLFQGDLTKVQWPVAVPGASMDNCPSGMGGEDFGGFITTTPDHRVFIQAGKTGFWNVEVLGLDNVKRLGQGTIRALTPADIARAETFKAAMQQDAVGKKTLASSKATPTFTGDLKADFPGATQVKYQKQENLPIATVTAWDDANLYVGWQVEDKTPWMNGASDPRHMYTHGDTVDLQLETDAKADPKRQDFGAGDLRLSIGNVSGKVTAVCYRKFSAVKQPFTFTSGTVKEYLMDYAAVEPAVKATVKVTPGKGYVVEAAIPWSVLRITPAAGMRLRGDFGVTYGDADGQRTRLRAFWSDQYTNIVDDVVWELVLHPQNWGTFTLQ